MKSTSKTLSILSLGLHNVGKTNLIKRFVENKFFENKTTPCELNYKEVILNNKETLNVHLWDICYNEEKYLLKPLKMHLKDKDGVLLIYDVNNKSTLEDLNILLENIKVFLSNKIPIILIGNKKDIKDGKYPVSTEEGKAFADKNGLFKFYEVSAKENINVKDSFLCLIEKAYQVKFN
jgi:small GTP-binding protein